MYGGLSELAPLDKDTEHGRPDTNAQERSEKLNDDVRCGRSNGFSPTDSSDQKGRTKYDDVLEKRKKQQGANLTLCQGECCANASALTNRRSRQCNTHPENKEEANK